MSMPSLSLTGKKTLVTGGSKGIGRAIALVFAQAGADVAISSQGSVAGQLEGVAEEIRKLGRKAVAIRADTSKKADVDRMTARVIEEFGKIDILVNNAGILVREPFMEISESDFDRLIAVDFKGYYLVSQAIGREMIKQKNGNIINISTQQAFKASTVSMGPYGSTKAAVVMMTRYMARELADHGIRVNSIAPGLTKTDFSKPTWTNGELIKSIEASLPLKHMAEPEEIADAVLFLASDASRYITGQTILMEGGGLL